MLPPGRHNPPTQRVAATIHAGHLGSLLGPAAARVAPTGRRPYSGADLQPQTFLRIPGPNDAASIEIAPLRINTRRALNRGRGMGTG